MATEQMTAEAAHQRIPHVCYPRWCRLRAILEAVAAGARDEARKVWACATPGCGRERIQTCTACHHKGIAAGIEALNALAGKGDGEAK